MSHTRSRKPDTRTETEIRIRRGKLVTEIETMGAAGMLDNFLFMRAEDAMTEAQVLAANVVGILEPDTRAEDKALTRYAVERIERAVGKQRMLRGGSDRR